MVPICEFCGFDYLDRTDHSNCGRDDRLRAEHLGRIQPAPTPTDEPSAHDLVIAELEKRKAFGIAKYGVTLQAGNGRDHLRDALDEVLDLAVYLMCAIQQQEETR